MTMTRPLRRFGLTLALSALTIPAGIFGAAFAAPAGAATCSNQAAYADPRAQAAVNAVAAQDQDVADGETALLQGAKALGTDTLSAYRNDRITIVLQNGYVWDCAAGSFYDAAASPSTAQAAAAAGAAPAPAKSQPPARAAQPATQGATSPAASQANAALVPNSAATSSQSPSNQNAAQTTQPQAAAPAQASSSAAASAQPASNSSSSSSPNPLLLVAAAMLLGVGGLVVVRGMKQRTV